MKRWLQSHHHEHLQSANVTLSALCNMRQRRRREPTKRLIRHQEEADVVSVYSNNNSDNNRRGDGGRSGDEGTGNAMTVYPSPDFAYHCSLLCVHEPHPSLLILSSPCRLVSTLSSTGVTASSGTNRGASNTGKSIQDQRALQVQVARTVLSTAAAKEQIKGSALQLVTHLVGAASKATLLTSSSSSSSLVSLGPSASTGGSGGGGAGGGIIAADVDAVSSSSYSLLKVVQSLLLVVEKSTQSSSSAHRELSSSTTADDTARHHLLLACYALQQLEELLRDQLETLPQALSTAITHECAQRVSTASVASSDVEGLRAGAARLVRQQRATVVVEAAAALLARAGHASEAALLLLLAALPPTAMAALLSSSLAPEHQLPLAATSSSLTSHHQRQAAFTNAARLHRELSAAISSTATSSASLSKGGGGSPTNNSSSSSDGSNLAQVVRHLSVAQRATLLATLEPFCATSNSSGAPPQAAMASKSGVNASTLRTPAAAAAAAARARSITATASPNTSAPAVVGGGGEGGGGTLSWHQEVALWLAAEQQQCRSLQSLHTSGGSFSGRADTGEGAGADALSMAVLASQFKAVFLAHVRALAGHDVGEKKSNANSKPPTLSAAAGTVRTIAKLADLVSRCRGFLDRAPINEENVNTRDKKADAMCTTCPPSTSNYSDTLASPRSEWSIPPASLYGALLAGYPEGAATGIASSHSATARRTLLQSLETSVQAGDLSLEEALLQAVLLSPVRDGLRLLLLEYPLLLTQGFLNATSSSLLVGSSGGPLGGGQVEHPSTLVLLTVIHQLEAEFGICIHPKEQPDSTNPAKDVLALSNPCRNVAGTSTGASVTVTSPVEEAFAQLLTLVTANISTTANPMDSAKTEGTHTSDDDQIMQALMPDPKNKRFAKSTFKLTQEVVARLLVTSSSEHTAGVKSSATIETLLIKGLHEILALSGFHAEVATAAATAAISSSSSLSHASSDFSSSSKTVEDLRQQPHFPLERYLVETLAPLAAATVATQRHRATWATLNALSMAIFRKVPHLVSTAAIAMTPAAPIHSTASPSDRLASASIAGADALMWTFANSAPKGFGGGIIPRMQEELQARRPTFSKQTTLPSAQRPTTMSSSPDSSLPANDRTSLMLRPRVDFMELTKEQGTPTAYARYEQCVALPLVLLVVSFDPPMEEQNRRSGLDSDSHGDEDRFALHLGDRAADRLYRHARQLIQTLRLLSERTATTLSDALTPSLIAAEAFLDRHQRDSSNVKELPRTETTKSNSNATSACCPSTSPPLFLRRFVCSFCDPTSVSQDVKSVVDMVVTVFQASHTIVAALSTCERKEGHFVSKSILTHDHVLAMATRQLQVTGAISSSSSSSISSSASSSSSLSLDAVLNKRERAKLHHQRPQHSSSATTVFKAIPRKSLFSLLATSERLPKRPLSLSYSAHGGLFALILLLEMRNLQERAALPEHLFVKDLDLRRQVPTKQQQEQQHQNYVASVAIPSALLETLIAQPATAVEERTPLSLLQADLCKSVARSVEDASAAIRIALALCAIDRACTDLLWLTYADSANPVTAAACLESISGFRCLPASVAALVVASAPFSDTSLLLADLSVEAVAAHIDDTTTTSNNKMPTNESLLYEESGEINNTSAHHTRDDATSTEMDNMLDGLFGDTVASEGTRKNPNLRSTVRKEKDDASSDPWGVDGLVPVSNAAADAERPALTASSKIPATMSRRTSVEATIATIVTSAPQDRAMAIHDFIRHQLSCHGATTAATMSTDDARQRGNQDRESDEKVIVPLSLSSSASVLAVAQLCLEAEVSSITAVAMLERCLLSKGHPWPSTEKAHSTASTGHQHTNNYRHNDTLKKSVAAAAGSDEFVPFFGYSYTDCGQWRDTTKTHRSPEPGHHDAFFWQSLLPLAKLRVPAEVRYASVRAVGRRAETFAVQALLASVEEFQHLRQTLLPVDPPLSSSNDLNHQSSHLLTTSSSDVSVAKVQVRTHDDAELHCSNSSRAAAVAATDFAVPVEVLQTVSLFAAQTAASPTGLVDALATARRNALMLQQHQYQPRQLPSQSQSRQQRPISVSSNSAMRLREDIPVALLSRSWTGALQPHTRPRSHSDDVGRGAPAVATFSEEDASMTLTAGAVRMSMLEFSLQVHPSTKYAPNLPAFSTAITDVDAVTNLPFADSVSMESDAPAVMAATRTIQEETTLFRRLLIPKVAREFFVARSFDNNDRGIHNSAATVASKPAVKPMEGQVTPRFTVSLRSVAITPERGAMLSHVARTGTQLGSTTTTTSTIKAPFLMEHWRLWCRNHVTQWCVRHADDASLTKGDGSTRGAFAVVADPVRPIDVHAHMLRYITHTTSTHFHKRVVLEAEKATTIIPSSVATDESIHKNDSGGLSNPLTITSIYVKVVHLNELLDTLLPAIHDCANAHADAVTTPAHGTCSAGLFLPPLWLTTLYVTAKATADMGLHHTAAVIHGIAELQAENADRESKNIHDENIEEQGTVAADAAAAATKLHQDIVRKTADVVARNARKPYNMHSLQKNFIVAAASLIRNGTTGSYASTERAHPPLQGEEEEGRGYDSSKYSHAQQFALAIRAQAQRKRLNASSSTLYSDLEFPSVPQLFATPLLHALAPPRVVASTPSSFSLASSSSPSSSLSPLHRALSQDCAAISERLAAALLLPAAVGQLLDYTSDSDHQESQYQERHREAAEDNIAAALVTLFSSQPSHHDTTNPSTRSGGNTQRYAPYATPAAAETMMQTSRGGGDGGGWNGGTSSAAASLFGRSSDCPGAWAMVAMRTFALAFSSNQRWSSAYLQLGYHCSPLEGSTSTTAVDVSTAAAIATTAATMASVSPSLARQGPLPHVIHAVYAVAFDKHHRHSHAEETPISARSGGTPTLSHGGARGLFVHARVPIAEHAAIMYAHLSRTTTFDDVSNGNDDGAASSARGGVAAGGVRGTRSGAQKEQEPFVLASPIHYRGSRPRAETISAVSSPEVPVHFDTEALLQPLHMAALHVLHAVVVDATLAYCRRRQRIEDCTGEEDHHHGQNPKEIATNTKKKKTEKRNSSHSSRSSSHAASTSLDPSASSTPMEGKKYEATLEQHPSASEARAALSVFVTFVKRTRELTATANQR